MNGIGIGVFVLAGYIVVIGVFFFFYRWALICDLVARWILSLSSLGSSPNCAGKTLFRPPRLSSQVSDVVHLQIQTTLVQSSPPFFPPSDTPPSSHLPIANHVQESQIRPIGTPLRQIPTQPITPLTPPGVEKLPRQLRPGANASPFHFLSTKASLLTPRSLLNGVSAPTPPLPSAHTLPQHARIQPVQTIPKTRLPA